MLARRPRSLFFSLLVTSIFGCGGAPATPPAAPPAGNAKVTSTPQLPPDLTPVADPDDLVLFGRVANPSGGVSTISGWLKSQLPGVPPVGSEAVTELLAGESIGELVDLDQPIDVAATAAARIGSAKGHFAVAAAVKSPEQAKAALSKGGRKLAPGPNGMLRVEGLGPPREADDEDEERELRSCALVPAVGASPMRFVCGFGPGSLEALAPWLTRTTPRLPSTSDVHVEMRFAPVHKFVQENRGQLGLLATLAMGKRGAPDAAMTDFLLAVMNEAADFALDLDTFAIDLKLNDTLADATVTTKYRSTTSLITRLSTYRPDRVDAPPSAFLRLPGDAEVAFFSRGVDPKDLERPRDLVMSVMSSQLTKEGVPSADAKPFSDAIGKLVTSSASVYGGGVDRPAVEKALAEARGEDATVEAKAALRDALVGWRLMGVEEPPARLTSAVREIVTTWNRPGLAKWVKAQNKDKPATTLKMAPLAKGMPKDALHVEMTVFAKAEKAEPKKKAVTPKPVRLHAYVVPDGTTTWLAFGATDALVAERARAAMSGAPEGATLAKRVGLEQMREAKLVGGGFVTMEGLLTTAMSLRAIDGHVPRREADALAILAAGPGKGTTPLPILLNVTPQQGGGAISVAQVRVPRAAIEDAVRLAVRGAMSL